MSTRNRSERENSELVLSVTFWKNVETAGKGQVFPLRTRKNMKVLSTCRRKEQCHWEKDEKVKGNADVTERPKNTSNENILSDFTKKSGLHYNVQEKASAITRYLGESKY